MRISSALVGLLLLAGCGERSPDTELLANIEAEAKAKASEGGQIPCALNGSEQFQRACTIDRTVTDQGLTLTVRHPDGGFHRLLVTKDGRGVVAADGAERAHVRVIGTGEIEVALADDRYRLPATVKGQ